MIIRFFVMAGETRETRFSREAQFNNNASGNVAGDTYSASDTQQLMGQYEALFGPAGRDIKVDSQRNKRHQRWHLPDSIKGYNSFLTDRIDGLITDATNSPFTRNILPYFYLENPDAKIKWNVYSFDEGMASRVPYESAARVLTQTKSSQSGYAIRQGLAIAMEHNFLASEAGRTNFKHQLTQLVGSIQLTNDLDVHIALLQAQSYEKIISEKYYGTERTLARTGKQYCDMFGIYNKIPNALDLLIEEARTKLKTWGSEPPTFLLCPSNLTLHLTMSPERTNYITNGPDGLKRLAQGPDLPSYRGLQIIHSQKFALEAGREPRNVLRRKVRVAEYYWLPHDPVKTADCVYEFYDQSSDSFKNFTKAELIRKSGVEAWMKNYWSDNEGLKEMREQVPNTNMTEFDFKKCDVLVLRPNIEHEMLSVIMGRGGTQELGSTFWGQTELACYDDAQHGIWGMSYKYHERAIVTNERNLVRMFDVAFDGYNGGMGCDIMQWTEDGIAEFRRDTESLDGPYRGKSMLVLAFPSVRIKDAYQTLRIRNHVPAEEPPAVGENGFNDGGPPQQPNIDHEKPAENNERLDLERVLRKLATANPPHWTHTEPLLETLLSECKEAFEKLSVFMHLFEAAPANPVEYEAWVDYRNRDDNITGPFQYKDAAISNAREFQNAISKEIANLHIGQMRFTTRKDMFVYILLKVVMGFLAQSSYSALSMESSPFRLLHKEMDEFCFPDAQGDMATVTMQALGTPIHYMRILTNIDCESLLEALWHSKDRRYFDWLKHFYGLNDDMKDTWIAAEIPNPLILPTMFMSESASPGQVFVDSESTMPISDHSKYDLARFLTQNMTRNVYTKQRDVNGIYGRYATHLESLFNSQVNIQPGENIRSNTTQIPTLCYHGNMRVRQAAYVTQDIKCTGHMGNSYPGMASVREGRGVQSMTLPAQIMHLQ